MSSYSLALIHIYCLFTDLRSQQTRCVYTSVSSSVIWNTAKLSTYINVASFAHSPRRWVAYPTLLLNIRVSISQSRKQTNWIAERGPDIGHSAATIASIRIGHSTQCLLIGISMILPPLLCLEKNTLQMVWLLMIPQFWSSAKRYWRSWRPRILGINSVSRCRVWVLRAGAGE